MILAKKIFPLHSHQMTVYDIQKQLIGMYNYESSTSLISDETNAITTKEPKLNLEELLKS